MADGKHASGSLQVLKEKQNITQAEFSKCGVSPWGVIGLCLACFEYPPGPLQIAGHVASVTFSMRRCRWGAVLLEKHGGAEGGHADLLHSGVGTVVHSCARIYEKGTQIY